MYRLNERQLRYARLIEVAARLRDGFGRKAAVLAVACAGAESSLTNYENWGTSTLTDRMLKRQLNDAERAVAARSKGLGDGPYRVRGEVRDNLDSMGLYAQRPMMGWGEPEQIMRPDYAVGKFLDRLGQVPDWGRRPAADVIATVQGYYDATIYGAWLATAEAVVGP